jgi:hypothetical protein
VQVRVSYCAPSMIGGNYGSGFMNMDADTLTQWLVEQTAQGKPVLITAVETRENWLRETE